MSNPWNWPPPVPPTPAVAPTTDTVTNVSLVPGATASDALDSLLGSVNTLAVLQSTFRYILPPTVPNAFDDEFLNGSPDLAARGYTVVNAATGVVQTRSGGIDPWSAAGPAAGTYWSTLQDSWLYIQAPAGIQLDVYKTIVLAAGDTFFARTTGSFGLNTNVVSRFNEVGLYGASGAQLDNNNRVYTAVQDDPSAFYLQMVGGRVTAGAFSGVNRLTLAGHDIRGVFFDSGTTHSPFLLDSENGQPSSMTVTGTPAAATLTRFALRNAFSAGGGAVPQIWGIDFIRRKTGRAWLI